MNKLTHRFFKKFIATLFVSTIAFSSWAISLDDAKQKGLVGEMPNGYIGVIVDSPEVQSLVESINEKRKSIYIDLARKNKLTMQQVTALAGAKAIEKTMLGHFIQDASGNWVKK